MSSFVGNAPPPPAGAGSGRPAPGDGGGDPLQHPLVVAALDGLTEGLVILDRDWRFTYVNAAAERFILKSRAELLGQNHWELFPEASHRRFGAEYRRAVTEHVPVHFEEFYPEPLNCWYEVRAYPSPEGLSIFFRDVTRRRQVEDALRESEARYRALFSSMAQGFAVLETICDEHGVPCDSRFLEVNPAFEGITGLTRDQVIGRLGSEVFPADHAYWVKTYGAVALNGEAITVEHSTPGAGRHYDVVAFSPAPGQFAVIFHDITERRRLEEERRVLLTKYAVLFDSFPLGISITDASGTVREGNATALRLLGTSEHELVNHRVGVPQWRIIRPDGSPMPPEEFASVRAFKEQTVVDDVETGVARDGEDVRWFSVSAAPLPLEGYGVVITYGDISRRRAAEAALRRSAEQHRTIIQTAMDGFWLVDAEGRLLEVNAAYCRMSGYSEQELLGTRVADIEAGETAEQTAAHIRDVIASGEDRFESRHRRKDGSVFDVEVSVQYRPAAGQFVSFLRDITERKAAERALRASEERHRTIIQTAADGFWLVDLRGRLLEVNDAYCRMSGYSARELLAMSIPDLEALETPEETAARIQALIARGEERFESRHRRKDGSTFDVEVSVKYWLADTGRFVVFLRDVSERKKVTAALEEAHRAAEAARAKLEAVMDALPIGLAIVDAEGGIVRANAAFDRIWGNGRPVARSVADYQLYKARWLDTGRDLELEEWASTRAVRQGETVIGQALHIERFDGGHAYVLNSAAPILDEHGRPAGCAVAIQDIGKRIEAERALARSEAALREANEELAAANLALRYANEALEARVAERTADLAQRSAQLRALALDSTRAEERERQRVAQVIHDHLQQLLSVARINLGMALGRVRTESTRQHLGEADSLLAESLEVTRSLTAELSPAILHRSGLAAALRWLGRWYRERFGLDVAVEVEADVELGHENRVALFRAVRELLFNVVKHAEVAKARVQLSQTGDHRARIVVSDNGVGFDPEMLRAREGTTRSFGLSSLRERLELLGGRLEVESAPGQGASFTIIAPPPGPAEPEAGSTPPVAPLKIAVRKHTGVRHGHPARKKPR